jgi:hypothetical protein
MLGVGGLGSADLKGASQKSCSVLRDLGPQVQWVHSYVTDDKIYCIYRAPLWLSKLLPRARRPAATCVFALTLAQLTVLRRTADDCFRPIAGHEKPSLP